MSTALSAELRLLEPQVRLGAGEANDALAGVVGIPAVAARARLRFGPGRTCEPLARVLDRALTRAEDAGLDPAGLVLADGAATPGEDIVRVRRKAHGVADWIHSPTCEVRVVLVPAGLYATVDAACSEVPAAVPHAGIDLAVPGVAAVREALFEVIDPDLGINVVDLGFVRGITIADRTAVLTMTLTSPACPLTGVMEDQIRAGLRGIVDDFRVEWVWAPAWRPGDITADGREQLRAIGFTV